jgi:hypothetical protein
MMADPLEGRRRLVIDSRRMVLLGVGELCVTVSALLDRGLTILPPCNVMPLKRPRITLAAMGTFGIVPAKPLQSLAEPRFGVWISLLTFHD